MIVNPPPVIVILKCHAKLQKIGAKNYQLAWVMSKLFLRYFGRMDWSEFQRLYHLYFQSIPMDIAKEAWGLIAVTSPYLKQPHP